MRKMVFFPPLLFTVIAYTQPKLIGTLSRTGTQNGGAIFRSDLPGSAPGIIHSFNHLSPHRPNGGLCAGDADWLYGNLIYNGSNGNGALYKILRDGTSFTKLYDYDNPPTTADYLLPVPYYHTDGNIYFSNGPQLKKMDPATGIVSDLPGVAPVYTRNLAIDSDGWIFFPSNAGTLAKTKSDGTQYTDIHVFDPLNEGYLGRCGVTEVAGDSLFGILSTGGPGGEGCIYSIHKDGSGFIIHHQFAMVTGYAPESKLVHFDGRLFGSTSLGGNFDRGVIYTINTDGSDYRVLYHFDGGVNANGTLIGNISISSNGRIFGSTSQAFFDGISTYRLFKVDTSGADFRGLYNGNTYEIGHFTQDVLLVNDEELFFPMAEWGRHDGGVLNHCDTSGSGNPVYHFGIAPNGFRPSIETGLIKASDGKLYGTTTFGGTDGGGIIYSVNADGTGFTRLHEFIDAEGFEPAGKLLEASDGKLYGALKWDIATTRGSLYRMNKNGSGFEIIHRFSVIAEGYGPNGNLVEDNNGILYGTTFYSAPGAGTLYRVNKDGSNFTVLKVLGLSSSDLFYPYSGFLQAGACLYSTCGYGGIENKGGIFRIRKDGSGYEVLHEFAGTGAGSIATSPPILASNGKLYGTTSSGGPTGEGTLYRIDTTGSNFTNLKTFTAIADGAYPWAGLIQASDGLIYGTTTFSTISPFLYGGTIYRINPDGTGFTIIREFDPQAEGEGVSMLLDLNGSFVLPVQLLTFTGEKSGQTVLLSWKTAQEQHNDHFEIERSADGNNFTTIGTLTGAGNTNAITSYSFSDTDPLAGINYYRLKQVDIDGRFEYSRFISVSFNNLHRLTVFPNPATERLNIRLPQGHRFTSIRIIDGAGRIMMQRNLGSSITSQVLDIAKLPAGWYIVQLTGQQMQQQLFLKQ